LSRTYTLTLISQHGKARRASRPAQSPGKAVTHSNCLLTTIQELASSWYGHKEVFIIYLLDGEEEAEISIDRMTEENDTSAPL